MRQLASFDKMSWGTAYQTIAEVQVVIKIGKVYLMSVNFARHNISTGRFIAEEDRPPTDVEIQTLGSYLNGQSVGTWANKLTFFFAVYDFLERTKGVAEERLGTELYEIRQAMASWGVSPGACDSFLPAGDPRASYLLTPARNMIRQYRNV